MQDPPEKTALLAAVTAFLGDPRWKTAIQDPALAYRMRIAAHLVDTVRRELAHEDAHDRAELARLEALLEETPAPTDLEPSARRARITALNRALGERLRSGGAPDLAARALACLKATLIEKLSVTQPRFDTSSEIE